MKSTPLQEKGLRVILVATLASLSIDAACAGDRAGAYIPETSSPLASSGSSGNFLSNIFGRPEEGSALQGFYYGFGVGMISTDYADSVNDGSVSMIGGEDEGAAFSFLIGYRINDIFAIEGSFTQSDDVDYNAVSDGSGDSWALGPVSAGYDAEFITLAAVARYPIAPRWWGYAKLGLTWWETTETFNEGGFISTDTDSGSEVFLGLGLEYDPGQTDRVLYRFEVGYQPVGGDDDLDIFSASIGVRYEFP